MKATEQQMNRTTEDWARIAKEKVTVEQSENGFTLCAYGSEVACLRLFYAYRRRHDDLPHAEVRYNPLRESWLFTLNTTT